ncbi:MAG TPA: ankyrin repeat domain-containing protein [Gemmatimonadales bacterium]|nr:ankyrin repeat domain-containing protein [Gemmatimonadales bacterium]
MYPNPQDAVPLPPRPDLEQYRRRAKELVKACRSGGDAIHAWATQWVETLLALQPDLPDFALRDAVRRAQQITDFARGRLGADCALSQAQFVLARAHGFASWPRLVHHIEALTAADPLRSAFERAADAIVNGDLPALERLLGAHPHLVRERSERDHNSTLLHYASANGVESYRQKTPSNIVPIARMLLDAGAEVDAEADVYGRGATTLALAVTSSHPRAAGLQIPLADLLLERGARVDRDIVRYALVNGCPEVAAHMAERGAPLDLEGAAGIGRVDVVATCFEPPRTVSEGDAGTALIMAAWYDQLDVIAFLLDRGVAPGTRRPIDGNTALHVASYCGSPRLVELLLARGAPVDVTDLVYGTPPLVWALHAWLAENRSNAEDYRAVLRLLVGAGAEVQAGWIEDERVRRDRELYTALAERVEQA